MGVGTAKVAVRARKTQVSEPDLGIPTLHDELRKKNFETANLKKRLESSIDESNFLRSETKEMEYNLKKLSRETEDLKLELKSRSNISIDRSREIHLEQEILELRSMVEQAQQRKTIGVDHYLFTFIGFIAAFFSLIKQSIIDCFTPKYEVNLGETGSMPTRSKK